MFLRKLFVVTLVLAVAGGVSYYFLRMRRVADDPNVIRVSGNIEVIEAQLGFKIAGRVEKRLVDEGEVIEQGDLIAVLDMSDLTCEVAARAAELKAAEAALAEMEHGSRPQEIAAAMASTEKSQALLNELLAGSRPQEIAVAKAALARATADKTRLESDLSRATQLRAKNVMTAEEYDRAKAAYDVAEAQVREAAERLDLATEGPRKEQIEQARAALAQMKSQYELIREGPRAEQIEQARAQVELARATLRLAETRLGYATLVSPLPGVVLSKSIEPGEYVAPGTPVITVGNLKDIWLRAYVSQADQQRVKVGQPARVGTGLVDKFYDGRVSFISSEAEFTPKTVQTPQEREKLVYRIKIDIDNPNMELKPGMPADAWIELAPAQTPPLATQTGR